MRSRLSLGIVILGAGLSWSPGVEAAAPPPRFNMIGFIQEATLDTSGTLCTPAIPARAGGTVTINGVKMIVPCNTVLQLPARSVTWGQLFDVSLSAPVSPLVSLLPPSGPASTFVNQGQGETGLALADSVAPFPSFEVNAVGNVLVDPVTGGSRYVIGLIAPLSQQSVNAGAGRISYIDYGSGTLRVGGIPGDPSCLPQAPGGGPSCSGALVQINDPVGRFGKAHSHDPRFSADTLSPTVHAATGFPVCIPRVPPTAAADDPECPQGNRPRNGDPRFPTDPSLPMGAFLTHFDMPAPVDGVLPDARKQVPLEIGDWITFQGTLVKIDRKGPNSAANTYVSAHTLDANLGIFTAPGVQPAYVWIDSLLIGTAGNPVGGIGQESSTQLTVTGFTTDPTQLVDIFAVDVDPCSGQETARILATVDPAVQVIRGRFIERMLGGFFMPPTREYMVASHTGVMSGVSNGLDAGVYRAPNLDFIFPENLTLGDPIVPGNFQDMPFLAQGSGAIGPQLAPWPGSAVPPDPVCTAIGADPIAVAGTSFSAVAGTTVTLSGSMTLDPHSTGATITWTQTAGPPVTLTNPDTLTPSFTAPSVMPGTSVTLAFQLTVTDQIGTGISSTTVTVTQPNDTIAFTAASWKFVGGGRRAGTLTVTATSTTPGVTLTLDAILTANAADRPLGTLAETAPGVFGLSSAGVSEPSSLILRSSGGGSATAVCGAPNARGVVTCQ